MVWLPHVGLYYKSLLGSFLDLLNNQKKLVQIYVYGQESFTWSPAMLSHFWLNSTHCKWPIDIGNICNIKDLELQKEKLKYNSHGN